MLEAGRKDTNVGACEMEKGPEKEAEPRRSFRVMDLSMEVSDVALPLGVSGQLYKFGSAVLA